MRKKREREEKEMNTEKVQTRGGDEEGWGGEKK